MLWLPDDTLLILTVQRVALLFLLGLLLVLYFARRDLRTELRGELGQRYLSWMILAPLFLLATFAGGAAGLAILAFFFYRLVLEYSRMVGIERPYLWFLVLLVPLTVAVAALMPSLYSALPAASILLLTLVPLLSGRIDDLYSQLTHAGRGYLYLVWSVGHLILLRQIGGVGFVVLVGVGVALSDVMQYSVGKLIGRHVIAPAIHPQKAYEGLIGDLIGAGAAVALFRFGLPEGYGWPHLVALTLLIALGSAWGDLLSSLIKRASGAKDWGRLLPGHGGMLDRANSLVITIPVVYYFVVLVQEYGLLGRSTP